MATVSQWEKHLRSLSPANLGRFDLAIQILKADPLYGAERGLELGQLDIMLDEINKDPQKPLDLHVEGLRLVGEYPQKPAFDMPLQEFGITKDTCERINCYILKNRLPQQKPAFDMAEASRLATVKIPLLWDGRVTWETVTEYSNYANDAQRFIRELLK